MRRANLAPTLFLSLGAVLCVALVTLAARKPSSPSSGSAVRGTMRLGVNLAALTYWSTEQPFANLAKHGSQWRTQPEGKPFTWDAPPPQLNADKYPTQVPPGSYVESFLLGTPHREHLPPELVVLYDGKGQLEYAEGARLKTRAPGRDVIVNDVAGGNVVARVLKTDAANPLRNVRLYEPGIADRPPMPTFRGPFLQRWSKMAAFRFMDWMQTNDSKVQQWSHRPLPNDFTQTSGVALEHMIDLANTQKISPWFCMPHLADDDFVRRFAQQVKRGLDPSLPVYVEYSNEVWNGIFGQAKYAQKQGQALKLSGNEFEAQLRFYSRRSVEIFRIWDQVFGEQKGRVLGVLAAQSGNAWTSESILLWKDAYRAADVLAIAPYFGGSLGSPETAKDVRDWSLDKLFQKLSAEVDGENRELIRVHVALGQKYGLPLVAYEGGQHLAGNGGAENDEKLEKLFLAANRDPRMKDLYLKHLQHWRDAGGGLYVLFNSMTLPGKWGSWGLLETEGQALTSAPKWQAVEAFRREAQSDGGSL